MKTKDVRVRLTVRLPRSLDQQIAIRAGQMGLPKNTYINLKLSEAIGNEATTLKTETA